MRLPATLRATSRPANPDGVVFIIEYHKVLPKETRWGRSVAKFRQDLERLYELGFRPVTLNAVLEGALARPPGSEPLDPFINRVFAAERE